MGPDEYEKLRSVDRSTLEFKPEYDIHVTTVTEEYEAIAKALRSEGFRVTVVNIQDRLPPLLQVLRREPPDVVFNLVEHFRDDANLELNVAGLCELYGIPYTGSAPFSLALCQRKGLT